MQNLTLWRIRHTMLTRILAPIVAITAYLMLIFPCTFFMLLMSTILLLSILFVAHFTGIQDVRHFYNYSGKHHASSVVIRKRFTIMAIYAWLITVAGISISIPKNCLSSFLLFLLMIVFFVSTHAFGPISFYYKTFFKREYDTKKA